MIRCSRLSAIIALSALAGAAFSATVVGKWTGHFHATYAFRPANPPAGFDDKVKEANALLTKIVVILTIKSSGTYVATTKSPGHADTVGKGTWKLVGKKLTLTPDPEKALMLNSKSGTVDMDPKTNKPKETTAQRPPEVGVLSANGKVLTVELPASMTAQGFKGNAIFTRA